MCFSSFLRLKDHRAERRTASSHLQAFPDADKPAGSARDAGGDAVGRADGRLRHARLRGPRGKVRRPVAGGAG